ncbi:MAG: alpha-ribazole phosphatase [Spirochaetota bacterium]
MEIYLVRHTKVANAAGLCYGRTDVALAASFAEEVAVIQSKIPKNYSTIYTSPLTRCQTLATKFTAKERNVDTRLQELDFGQWENRLWKDIARSETEPWMQDFVYTAPPGGESFVAMYRRVEEFLQELVQIEAESVLVVTHAGVLRCIWAWALEIPLQKVFRLKISYGQKFRLSYLPKWEELTIEVL